MKPLPPEASAASPVSLTLTRTFLKDGYTPRAPPPRASSSPILFYSPFPLRIAAIYSLLNLPPTHTPVVASFFNHHHLRLPTPYTFSLILLSCVQFPPEVTYVHLLHIPELPFSSLIPHSYVLPDSLPPETHCQHFVSAQLLPLTT